MTSSQHLILFDGYDEEEELPAIGSRIEVSELREFGWKACLAPAHLPFSVTVDSYIGVDSPDRCKGFFGLVEVSSLTEEQVKAFKQRGLFQTPILSNPQDLKIELAQGKVEVDIWVFQASANADLDRFKRAFQECETSIMEEPSNLIFKEFVQGRENWQEVDWEQEWIRNLNENQSLIKTANTYAFILLGDYNHSESDPKQDIIRVIVPLDQRKDPIRTFRCTVDFAGGALAAMAGLGRPDYWYFDEVTMEEVDPVVRSRSA